MNGGQKQGGPGYVSEMPQKDYVKILIGLKIGLTDIFSTKSQILYLD